MKKAILFAKKLVALLLILGLLLQSMPLVALANDDDLASLDASETPALIFDDISPTDWFYETVMQAVALGLFQGTDGTKFSPYITMTRAMYITVLGRMAGIDVAAYGGASSFSDVDAEAYYAPYVKWAKEKGIVDGISESLFAPNAVISREQMAVMTMRFFKALNISLPTEIINADNPGDESLISPWALDDMLKLWQIGLLMGDNGLVNPQGEANRAEGATFLVRVNAVYNAEDEIVEDPPAEEAISSGGSSGGGGGGGGGNTTDTITINYDYVDANPARGIYANIQVAGGSYKVDSGTKVSELLAPDPANGTNYILSAWFEDKEATKPVDPDTVLNSSTTLYAALTEANAVSQLDTRESLTTIDVSSNFQLRIGTHYDDAVIPPGYYNSSLIKITNLSDPENLPTPTTTTDIRNFIINDNNAAVWTAGDSYRIEILDTAPEDWAFFDENGNLMSAATDTYNFTVARTSEAPILNSGLLNSNLIEIPINEVGGISLANAAAPVALSLNNLEENENARINLRSADTVGSFTTTSSKTIMVGDIVAIYNGTAPSSRTIGENYDAQDDGIRYVKIESIIEQGSTKQYVYSNAQFSDIVANTDDAVSAEQMYVPVPVSGTDLAQAADQAQIINDIQNQIQVSGFAETTAAEVAALTLQTDEVANLLSANGFNGSEIAAIQSEMPMVQAASIGTGLGAPTPGRTTVTLPTAPSVNIRSGQTEIADGDDGLMLTVSVPVKITIDTSKRPSSGAVPGFGSPSGINPTQIVIDITAVFEQHLSLEFGFNIDDLSGLNYKATVDTEIGTYTGIGLLVTAVFEGVEPDEEPMEMPFKSNTLDKVTELNDQLNTLMDKKDEFFGEPTATVSGDLQSRYQDMLGNTEWVDIINVPLLYLQARDPLMLFSVSLDIDFIVAANMSVSAGVTIEYETKKLHTFTAYFGTNKNDLYYNTTDLMPDTFTASAYLMGSLGARAGIRSTVTVALITPAVANAQISAEAGLYARLYGYCYYTYQTEGGKAVTDDLAGAFYSEFGAYVDVDFSAGALANLISYGADIYEEEWPFFTLGEEQQIIAYSGQVWDEYEFKITANGGGTEQQTIYADEFTLEAMSLTSGEIESLITDYRDEPLEYFSVITSHPAFTVDEYTIPDGSYTYLTLNIDVDALPTDVNSGEEELIITWKGSPKSLSLDSVIKRIPIKWEKVPTVQALQLALEGGSMPIDPASGKPYKAGYFLNSGDIVTLPTPSRQGYNFDGWFEGIFNYGVNAGYQITGGEVVSPYSPVWGDSETKKILVAKWTAQEVNYTVRHFKEGLNGEYVLADSETKKAIANSEQTENTPKTYSGYEDAITKSITKTIAPNGSTMFDFYYPRASYAITYNPNYDVSQGNPADTFSIFYHYGEPIDPPSYYRFGYSLDYWQGLPAIMPANSLNVSAIWAAGQANYMVNHYYHMLDDIGGSTDMLYSTDIVRGTIGSSVQAIDNLKHTDTGISFNNTKGTITGSLPTIAADGSTVVDIYYSLNNYNIIFMQETTQVDSIEAQYLYQLSWLDDEFTAAANALDTSDENNNTRTFIGWYYDAAFTQPFAYAGQTMPAEDLTLYARVDINDSQSKISYQNMHGSLDNSLPITYTNTETGSTLTIPAYTGTYKGHTFSHWQLLTTIEGSFENNTLTFAANDIGKNLIFNAVWTPNTYQIVYDHIGFGVVEEREITYPYGQKNPSFYTFGDPMHIPIDDRPERPGYEFLGWTVVGYNNGVDSEGKNTVALPYQFATHQDPPASGTFTIYGYWAELTGDLTINLILGDQSPTTDLTGVKRSANGEHIQYEKPDFTVSDPFSAAILFMDHYTFDGWYLNGRKLANLEQIHPTIDGEKLTIEARFTPHQYNYALRINNDAFYSYTFTHDGTEYSGDTWPGDTVHLEHTYGVKTVLPTEVTRTGGDSGPNDKFLGWQWYSDIIAGNNNYITQLDADWHLDPTQATPVLFPIFE